MFSFLRRSLSRIFRYSGAEEYSRRYAVVNAFDGVVTILGIVLGSTLLGEASARSIIAAGIGALIAMGISGASGTYMAEKAEQERRIREIEEAMLTSLEKSVIAEARERAAIISALIDALSAVLAGLFVLSPYFAADLGLLSAASSFYFSVELSLALLFALGLFLGRIARRNLIISGLKSLGIGCATILLITLLNVFL
ncbi:MAG: hypothetical protein DRN61_03340 [Thaumarchaeota archaeon]|nr:MAG: hypothetical protein DRN61_03340 [Nitrososphaerota archaeon]